MEQRVVTLQSPSATGNQDYTVTGFGTPDACIVFTTNGDGGGTFNVHGAGSVGVYDGTNQVVLSQGTQDSIAADSNTARSNAENGLVVHEKYSSALRRTASASFITNGVRLNWNSGGDRPWVTIWMFKGVTAVRADWNDPDNTQDTAKTIATTGVDPNLILFAMNRQTSLGGATSHAGASFGFAYDTGSGIENLCAAWTSQQSDPTDTACQVFDATGNRCAAVVNGGGNAAPGLECTAMGVDDFEVTTRDGSGVVAGFVYLALEITETVKTFSAATPNAAGDWDPVATGFTPQCLFMAGCPITAFNSNVGGSVGTECIAMYIANDDGDESGHAVLVENGVAGVALMPSESQQVAAYELATIASGAETIVFKASNPTFDASGVVFADADVDHGSGAYSTIGFMVQNVAGPSAPVLSATTDDQTGSTTSNGAVTSDTASGTISAVVTTSATTPTHAQIAAGQDHLGATADASDSIAAAVGTNNLSFTGLTASTAYFTHFAQSGTPNATPVTADGFTTLGVSPVLTLATDSDTSFSTSTGGVTTDTTGGTISGVVTTSATTPTHTQIANGQDHTGATAAADTAVAAITGINNLAFSGLAASTAYFTHFTQSGSPNATPISASGFTTPVAPANSPPVVDTPIPDQVCTVGVAFGPLDVSGNFSDPDADPLTFSQVGLPNGLVISAGGVISGTPTGGFQT